MFKKYEAVVVGTGFCGSLIGRWIAEELNKKVVLLERRSHVAGNMYDEIDGNGIRVQRYGPHSFRTDRKELFEAIEKYSEWMEFRANCLAVIKDVSVPCPFGYATIDAFYSESHARLLKSKLEESFKGETKVGILDLLASGEPIIKQFAEFLVEEDYRPYTAKQWGIQPEDIDASVLRRVPVRLSYCKDYFDYQYQYIPKNGFTALLSNIIDHPNIDVVTNFEAMDCLSVDREKNQILLQGEATEKLVVFTGAIDQLFDYCYDRLPYRSLVFDYKTYEVDSFQDAPLVVHPKAEGYTRVTEYKKLPMQDIEGVTTVVREYPVEFIPGQQGLEPYYPLLTKASQEKCAMYKEAAAGIKNLFVCGRLGDFKYYDMDDAIERALDVYNQIKAGSYF